MYNDIIQYIVLILLIYYTLNIKQYACFYPYWYGYISVLLLIDKSFIINYITGVIK